MIKNRMIFALAFSLFSALVFAVDTPSISQQALLTALKAPEHNIIILDVRSEEEYNQGHINNAINVSHDMVEEKLGQLAQYKDSTVVVYCRSGRRAGIAEAVLSKSCFNHIRHLTGDMNGWLEAKLPVVINKRSH